MFLYIVDWCDYYNKRSHLKCISWHEQSERKRLVKPRANLGFRTVVNLVVQEVLKKKAFIGTLDQDHSRWGLKHPPSRFSLRGRLHAATETDPL